jgi:hypothetical protein
MHEEAATEKRRNCLGDLERCLVSMEPRVPLRLELHVLAELRERVDIRGEW